MELYGCWCSPYFLAPMTCLGLAAQYAALRDIIWSVSPPPLPAREETQTGWAALPDELLARVLELALAPAKMSGTRLLCASEARAAARVQAHHMPLTAWRPFAHT